MKFYLSCRPFYLIHFYNIYWSSRSNCQAGPGVLALRERMHNPGINLGRKFLSYCNLNQIEVFCDIFCTRVPYTYVKKLKITEYFPLVK